ncbi:serine racemase VanT catalytic subunit [Ruminococcus sp. OA3]|uniref:serine racemase VanT catalytic subunit n=1 Tax=Ruminococcus sp. OA3 TaxID=2914164 RepID=UPI001F06ED5C|nr:serine racemase VanT catalytic subunit [Ruminococcus sp. OA3]MCH1982538.1 serine racemase VanT catalytic subunit [Ruminococcus sp. OA3]
MSRGKDYTGIDYARLTAAFLVVAIHTSPLASFGDTGDFILTRIFARAAVPFFFMTSGFFLISGYGRDTDKLVSFVKKTAVIYGCAILFYLPLNLYNGYFNAKHLLPNILKDLVFDGTLYHLWYLPASVVGAGTAWMLVKRFGIKRALAPAALLYTVGLFGDSYYGIAEKIPLFRSFYAGIFEVSDYTRNGIFFAPLFFVMGGIIAEQTARISLRKCLTGTVISFSLMLAEGMILHYFQLQRHDSMYVMLIPVMYFLFATLTFWRGRRIQRISEFALLLYLVHPMMIVVVRLFAGLSGLQALLVENSLVHFLTVCAVSAACSAAAVIIWDRWSKKRRKPYRKPADRAWIEVDLDNLKHNVRTLKKAMPPGCRLMAVVKANAYGHGAFETAVCLERIGVTSFAAATIDEGIALRRWGIRGDILILGYTEPSRAEELHRYRLIQTLIDYPYAKSLIRQGYSIRTQVKIDTGMHRLGFGVEDREAILKTVMNRKLNVCGIYTHLCAADSLAENDVKFTGRQIEVFYELLDWLKEQKVTLPDVHIQSTYGLLNYPELNCSYVRAGISLYGVLSAPNDKTRLQLDLRPVLSLRSQVVLIREIKAGECVGYGRMFKAERDSRIAILPIGYADGIPRNLSCGNGEVLIRGCRVLIAGRISMDQLAVDITDIPDAAVGDIATLIGRDGQEELKASEAAWRSGSITNELLSRMGTRVVVRTQT